MRGMGIWLGGAAAAAGLLALTTWLAYLTLPLQASDRIAIGIAVGTALDSLVAAWLTVRAADPPDRQRKPTTENTVAEGSTVMAGAEERAAEHAADPAPSRPAAPIRPRSSRLTLAELRQLSDLMLEVQEIRSPVQWQLFLNVLPNNLRQAVPRQASDRTEVIALLQTCAEFPGAWDGLDNALQVIAPGSAAALAVSEELRRLRLLGGQLG